MELVLQIVAYGFDMLVLYIFYQTIFVRRQRNLLAGTMTAVYIIVQILTASINYLYHKMWCNFLISITGLLVIAFLYEGSVARRLLAVVLYQLMAMLSELLGVFVFGTQVLKTDPKAEMTELVISKIILFVGVLLVKLIYRNKKDLSHKFFVQFLIMPLLSIVILRGLYSNNSGDLFWYFSLLSLLFLNLAIYYLLNVITRFVLEESKKQRMQEQINAQKEKYEHLTTSFLRGNRLLHDVNKHIRYIKKYLMENRVDDAISYINRTDQNLKEAYDYVHTGNLVIDSLVSNLKSQLNEKNCQLRLDINFDSCRLTMDDYDLVVVLGNILDNAVEAIETVTEPEKRKVEFSICMTDTAFLIDLRNGTCPDEKRKKEQFFHGLGLQNVEEVVEDYGGSMTVSQKDEWFETMIVIPQDGGEER